MKPFRRAAGRGLKLAVSVVVLGLIARRVDLDDTLARLSSPEPVAFALGVALIAAQWPVTALRWQRLLTDQGTPLSTRQALRVQLGSLAMSQALPTVGGDAWRIIAARRAGASVGSALRAVVLDRYFALVGVGILVALGHPWFVSLEASSPVATATSLGLGALWTFATVLFFSDHLLPRAAFPQRLVPWLDLGRSIRRLSFPPNSAHTLGTSVAAHLLTVAATWCFAKSLGVALSPLQALLVAPPVVLLAALPISLAGWGVREASSVLVFSVVAVPASQAVSVSVSLGLALLVTGLPGLFVVLGERAAASKGPAP